MLALGPAPALMVSDCVIIFFPCCPRHLQAMSVSVSFSLWAPVPRFGRIEWLFAQGIVDFKCEVFRWFGAISRVPHETKPYRIPPDRRDASEVFRGHQSPGVLAISS